MEIDKVDKSEDPWGVMVPVRYKSKRCKKCGELVEITRYKCPCEKWCARGDNLEPHNNPLDKG